jgi:hypothetical protein
MWSLSDLKHGIVGEHLVPELVLAGGPVEPLGAGGGAGGAGAGGGEGARRPARALHLPQQHAAGDGEHQKWQFK